MNSEIKVKSHIMDDLARSPVCASIAQAQDCYHPGGSKTKHEVSTKSIDS